MENDHNNFFKKICSRRNLIIMLILCVIVLPFIMDQLYGHGYLSLYPNYFSADTWFSFTASYFPATLLGILTIYQAYLIDKRDRQLQEILNRNRFSTGIAFLNKYDPSTKKIGKYTADMIRKELLLEGRQLQDQWKDGYILSIPLKNLSNIGLNNIHCSRIELNINNKPTFIYEDSLTATYTLCSDIYTIWIFWIWNSQAGLNEKLNAYFYNSIRKDDSAEFLDLTLNIEIQDNEWDITELRINLTMQNQDDTYSLQSRKCSILNRNRITDYEYTHYGQ